MRSENSVTFESAARTVFILSVMAGAGLVGVNALAAAKPGKRPAGGKDIAPVFLKDNPLKKLPSKPGPHIAKIKAMKPGTWLNLGSPAADPKWGRARGRSWGGQAMVPAPEFRGAMFTGEGVHAGVKPDGYGMDDWWFYDINSHAWICVWPGTNTRELERQVKEGKIKVDGKGRAVDGSGQPVPAHILVHTYSHLTYNPDGKKFAVFPTFTKPFEKYFFPGLAWNAKKSVKKSVNDAIDALRAQGLHKKKALFGPWTYDMKTGRFDLPVVKQRFPGIKFGVLAYIPRKKQYLTINGSTLAYFDPATGRPSRAIKTPLGGIEPIFCHDAKRDRIYCGTKTDHFHCINLKDNSSTRIKFPASKSHMLKVHSSSAVFDVANDRALVFYWGRGKSGKIYPIDAATNKVMKPVPFGPFKRGSTNAAFYDPELAVTFIFPASDSGDNGRMWVYRHKDAE